MQKSEDIIAEARGNELGWRRIKGSVVPFSSALGIGQYFSNLIRKRIHQQKPCNIVFTGEAGISKSYSAIAFARYLDPKFSIRNICLSYSEFMKAMLNLKEGEIIVLDEPEYIAGHRQWYKAQNQALVATLRSGRFKVHPVFIPCINKRLLDKTVRENLLQFMVNLEDRGEANVYRLIPSPFQDRTYNKFVCKLKIEMLDVSKCQRSWCYSCDKFNECDLLRAQYERKRQRVQEERYMQDLDKSQREEQRRITFDQWLEKAYENIEDFYYETSSGKTKLSVEKIQLLLGCSATMAQRLRQTLKTMSKEEVEALIEKYQRKP